MAKPAKMQSDGVLGAMDFLSSTLRVIHDWTVSGKIRWRTMSGTRALILVLPTASICLIPKNRHTIARLINTYGISIAECEVPAELRGFWKAAHRTATSARTPQQDSSSELLSKLPRLYVPASESMDSVIADEIGSLKKYFY